MKDVLQQMIHLDNNSNMSVVELAYTVVPMTDDDPQSEERYEALQHIDKTVKKHGGVGILDLSVSMASHYRAMILADALATVDDDAVVA